MLVANVVTVARARLAGFSLTVAPGEVVGVVGPSGVGKTTLAQVLDGRLRPDSGEVTIDGTPMRRGNRLVALIGQSPRAALNPRWSLATSISEPLILRGATADPTPFADLANLSRELLQRRPDAASEGQLQRACIARALAQEPRYLLCDEPTSALDPHNAHAILDLLRQRADAGQGVLLISHRPDHVARIADRVVQLGVPRP